MIESETQKVKVVKTQEVSAEAKARKAAILAQYGSTCDGDQYPLIKIIFWAVIRSSSESKNYLLVICSLMCVPFVVRTTAKSTRNDVRWPLFVTENLNMFCILQKNGIYVLDHWRKFSLRSLCYDWNYILNVTRQVVFSRQVWLWMDNWYGQWVLARMKHLQGLPILSPPEVGGGGLIWSLDVRGVGAEDCGQQPKTAQLLQWIQKQSRGVLGCL